MLYRELRSSQRSYYKNDPSSARYGRTDDRTGNRRNTLAGQGTNNRPHRKGNSVMVMSTTGWQESQEALQRDMELGTTGTATTSRSGSGVRSPAQGIMKTKEVTVETSPNTPNSTADSFEMVSFEKERH